MARHPKRNATGKEKVGWLVKGGLVRRRSIKRGRVFLPRRLSSIVFLATGGGISCRPTTRLPPSPLSPPVHSRNKREKYHRPFVSSRIVKVGQKLLWISRGGRGEEEEKIFGHGNCETGIAEGEQIENSFIYEIDPWDKTKTWKFSIFNRWIVRNSVEIFRASWSRWSGWFSLFEQSVGKWLNIWAGRWSFISLRIIFELAAEIYRFGGKKIRKKIESTCKILNEIKWKKD